MGDTKMFYLFQTFRRSTPLSVKKIVNFYIDISCGRSFLSSMWFSDGGLSPAQFYSCSLDDLFLYSFSLDVIAEFGHLSWETHCAKKYRWSNLIFFFFFFFFFFFRGPELHLSWTWIPGRYCRWALAFFILVLHLWIREVQHEEPWSGVPRKAP